MYDKIYNFDRENLICHDGSFDEDEITNVQSFMLISKQDGSITSEIQIPFEKKLFTVLIVNIGNHSSYSVISYPPIIPFSGNFTLIEPSSDTIYSYTSDHTMVPLITRSPSIQSMDPEVFLFLDMFTDRYLFMRTAGHEFQGMNLMYDKQENAIFEYTVHNDDYSYKNPAMMKANSGNDEIASWECFEAYKLIEAYESGKLKGKLKEIAAELDEDSNPVIMLIKHKK